MADAIFCFRLSRALESSSVLTLKNDEILKVTAENESSSEWQARTPNEHIAKIAALPRVDKKSVFLLPCSR